MQQFSANEKDAIQLKMSELSKTEKGCILLGKLAASTRSREVVKHDNKKRRLNDSTKERVTIDYRYDHRSVCKEAFMVLHKVSEKVIKNLLAHRKINGCFPRTYGNKGVTPSNKCSEAVKDNLLQYLTTYAEKYGLPQPTALSGRATVPHTYLPFHNTKRSVFCSYSESCQEAGTPVVSEVTFKKLWRKHLPHIKIVTRREDCCATCEGLRSSIMRAATDEQKAVALQDLNEHLTLAYANRDLYNDCIQRAKNGDCRHLIFDFAEQLSIPTTTRQVGPMYFKIGRRFQLFGVCDTVGPLQTNYLYDENETIGEDSRQSHGPNSVLSMFDHFLQERNHPHLILHADNCCGQNKNKTVLAYLAWRMLTNKNQSIVLHFMPPGHTRSLVDGGFGLIKMKYRRQDNYSKEDLIRAI